MNDAQKPVIPISTNLDKDITTFWDQHPQIVGASKTATGVAGYSGGTAGEMCGVAGISDSGGTGVLGTSRLNDGVRGTSAGSGCSGVAGIHSAGGHGVYGSSSGFAGYFDGNVTVTKDVTVFGDVVLSGQDCAERFDCNDRERFEPGTVVAAGSDGILQECSADYDKRVVGVVAGAGDYRPGLVLAGPDTLRSQTTVALIGRVYCKVDASQNAIEVGDLLTSSARQGTAMRATDPSRALGTVIGKALARLSSGSGMIPILVGLK